MNEWLDLLKSSRSYATRLVGPLASSYATSTDWREIGDFLALLGDEDRDLAIDGLDLLTADYLEFLREDVPRLLETLHRQREYEVVDVGPALSGNPLWGRTVVGWASGRLPPGRFVSRVHRQTVDLPENTALCLLLKELWRLAGTIARRLGSSTHPDIGEIAARASSALRDPTINSIPATMGPSEGMLRSAEGSRHPAYQRVGRLLRRRLALSSRADLGRWRRSAFASSLGSMELTPVEAEDIFELLALSQVLDALEHDLQLGPPRSYWMRLGTRAGSGPVVEFIEADGGTVQVYFDRTPAFLLDAPTPYTRVFRNHDGLGRSADRRPDIVIVRRPSSGPSLILFVEVKLPGGEGFGGYLRDSIYKSFGYLYDFAALWPVEQHPKVALFVPSDAGPSDQATWLQSDLLIISPRRPGDLSRAVGSALQLPLRSHPRL